MKFPVISTTLAMAVSGACAAAPNTAPMATTPKTAGELTIGPKTSLTIAPKAIPPMAPMNSDGAKIPPEPPMESVRLVAKTFPSMRMTKSHNTVCPEMALFMTG